MNRKCKFDTQLKSVLNLERYVSAVNIYRLPCYEIARVLHKKGDCICHIFRFTEAAEQFRHENFFPPIVSREIWEQAQVLLAERKERNVRAGTNQSILRYGGLLRCEDCGRTFVGKRIHLKSGDRVEYRCDTYHRYGKEYCSPHTVDERILDELITKELIQTKKMYEANFQAMEKLIDQWQPKASAATAQITKQQERIAMLEEETEAILMERIRDRVNAERYDRMIQKREAEIAAAQKQIEELQNIEETLRSRQAKLKRDIGMIDDILKEGQLSEAHLRLLVDKIYVHEEDGKLSLNICLKAPFRDHVDIYKGGEQTECWLSQDYDFERLGTIIMSDFSGWMRCSWVPAANCLNANGCLLMSSIDTSSLHIVLYSIT